MIHVLVVAGKNIKNVVEKIYKSQVKKKLIDAKI